MLQNVEQYMYLLYIYFIQFRKMFEMRLDIFN